MDVAKDLNSNSAGTRRRNAGALACARARVHGLSTQKDEDETKINDHEIESEFISLKSVLRSRRTKYINGGLTL